MEANKVVPLASLYLGESAIAEALARERASGKATCGS
jgi:hypothetical protein